MYLEHFNEDQNIELTFCSNEFMKVSSTAQFQSRFPEVLMALIQSKRILENVTWIMPFGNANLNLCIPTHEYLKFYFSCSEVEVWIIKKIQE